VDVIASSEVSLSMTLDSKQQGKDIPLLMSKLKEVAAVEVLEKRAIVTLISNLEKSSEVLSTAFSVLQKLG
jgi:aspartate kinase